MQEIYEKCSDYGISRFSNTDQKSYVFKGNRPYDSAHSNILGPKTETRSAKTDHESTHSCVIIDTTELSVIERSKFTPRFCCGWLLQLLVLGLFLGIYMNIAVPNREGVEPILIVVNTGVSSVDDQIFRDIHVNGGDLQSFLNYSDLDSLDVVSENLYHFVPLSEAYIKMQVR
jgi:hypothetical protein